MIGGLSMDDPEENSPNTEKKIVIEINGSYTVYGDIPLVRKTQVVSEFGEPLTWKIGETIKTRGPYILCRCGHTGDKPCCDGTHILDDFDGTETADTGTTVERQRVIEGGVNIVVKRDDSLCMDSGFCSDRFTNIDKMTPHSDNTQVRSQIIAMIERCPSGCYTYSIPPDQADIEPDLPQQIAAVTEITSEGPLEGPIWVTGKIPIVRSDGKPFETRNRVTLCGCGLSKIKPLCDGTHREKH
jgi:CDGSH-type Zn-finger protein